MKNRHQTTGHRLSSVLVSVCLVTLIVLLSGCPNLFADLGEEKSDKNGGTSAPTIEDFLTDFESALSASSVIDLGDAVGTIVSTARSATSSEGKSDFEAGIPLAVEGAQRALADLASLTDDDKRILALQAIVESAVGSIAAYKDQLADDLSPSSTDPKKSAMLRILSAISSTTVRSLPQTGISDARRGEAAGESVSVLIESTERAGVRRDYVAESAQQITQAAVREVRELVIASGGTSTDAKKEVVSRITEGATRGAVRIASLSQESEEVDRMIENVTRGATSALKETADDETERVALIGGVSAGFAEGVRRSSESQSMQATDVKRMVQAASNGTASAIRDIADDPDDNDETSRLLQAVSRESTRAVATVATAQVAGLVSGELIKDAVVGTAAGAQKIRDTGLDSATIEASIKIVTVDESGTETESNLSDLDATTQTELQQAVQDGVTIGNNEAPVADAGADQSVAVGETVTLDGSASNDEEDLAADLTYKWSISSAPELSAATITNSTSVTATFVPDLAGTYSIALRVTDSAGARNTGTCVITATGPAPAETYEGLTASERLEMAYGKLEFSDDAAARAQFLTILAHYPVTAEWRQAKLELASVYRRDYKYDSAIAALRDLIDNHSPSSEAAQAKVNLGWLYLAQLPEDRQDRDRALSLFQEVKSEYAGEWNEKSADSGIAYHTMTASPPDYETARTIYLDILADSSIPVHQRIWSQHDYAMSFLFEGGATNQERALTEMQRLIDESQFWTNDQGEIHSMLKAQAYWRTAQTQRWDLDDKSGAKSTFAAGMADADVALLERVWLGTVAGMVDGHDLNAYSDAITQIAAVRGQFESNADAAWAVAGAYRFEAEFYEKLYREVTRDPADLQQAIDLYTTVTDTPVYAEAYGGDYYVESTIRLAELHAWQRDDRDTAISLLDDLLADYPESADIWRYPWALERKGHFMVDRARSREDQVGYDWRGELTEAIAILEQIDPAAYPDYVSEEHDWFFRDAPGRIARAYSTLGEYELARSYYSAEVANDELSIDDRAWAQLELANTYRDEYRDLNDVGKWTDALAVFDTMVPELEAVEALTFVDGEVADNGRPWADALTRLTDDSWDAGEIALWETEETARAYRYLDAMELYFDEFTSLFLAPGATYDVDDWMILEVYIAKMVGLVQRTESSRDASYLDEADLAAAELDALYTDFTPENQYRALFELGDFYRDRANYLADLARDGEPVDPLADFAQCRDYYNEVITQAGSDPAAWPYDAEGIAKSYINLGRVWLDQFWFDQQSATAESAITAFDAAISVTEPVNDGEFAAEALRRKARTQNELASRTRWVDPQTATSRAGALADYEAARTTVQQLVAGVDDGTYSGADSHDYYEALRLLGDASSQAFHVQWDQYVNGERANAPDATLIEDAYATSQEIAFNDDERERVAWAYVDLANLLETYTRFLMDTPAVWDGGDWEYPISEIARVFGVVGWDTNSAPFNVDTVFAEFELYLDQVINDYSDVDDGRPTLEAHYMKAWLLKTWAQSFAYIENDGTGIPTDYAGSTLAERTSAAEAQIQTVISMRTQYQNEGWDWRVDEAESWVDTNGDLIF